MKHRTIAKKMLAQRLTGMIPNWLDMDQFADGARCTQADCEKISAHFIKLTTDLARKLRGAP